MSCTCCKKEDQGNIENEYIDPVPTDDSILKIVTDTASKLGDDIATTSMDAVKMMRRSSKEAIEVLSPKPEPEKSAIIKDSPDSWTSVFTGLRDIEGFLKYKSPLVPLLYSEYYFVLKGPGVISYWSSKDDHDINAVATGTIELMKVKPDGVQLHEGINFSIELTDATFYLSAATEDDAAHWVSATNHWIKYLGIHKSTAAQ